MKTNPNDSIIPIQYQDGNNLQIWNTTVGLTKREHMVIEFTKALLGRGENGYSDSKGNALLAIHQADELIKMLNDES